jgi:hypothetical protein
MSTAELRMEPPGYVELVFSLVLVWGFGDGLSTLFAMRLTGTHQIEANPLIRVMLGTEPLLLLVLKAGVVLYVGVVLLECRPIVERIPGWRAWFLGLVGTGAAISLINVYVGLAAIA